MNLNYRPLLFALLVSSIGRADGAPDLNILSQSGYIISSGPNNGFGTHQNWLEQTRLMAQVAVYDNVVAKIAEVVCGSDQNKSVLLVGEPSDTYRYIFARLAKDAALTDCARMAHVQIDTSSIEAGHHYVGDVDDYWKSSVLAPADHKDVVLYFDSLDAIIGIGSHANDDNGIEVEYAANITSGRMRTVAFSNQFEYQDILATRNAYVARSFAQVINIDALARPQVEQFVQSYLKIITPWILLGAPEMKYLLDTVAYYQPNVYEPQRTLTVLNYLAHKFSNGGQTVDFTIPAIESPHPYVANSNLNFEVKNAQASKIQLIFDKIYTETYDILTISDGNTGNVLQTISGNYQTGLATLFFPTNYLKLNFTSDSTNAYWGFKVGKARAQIQSTTTTQLTLANIREGVFYVAQVPQWLMERNYQVIKDLRGKLDADVVGVAAGKDEMIRLAKIGYITGRTDEKPVASTLYVGSTGTGKSYLAKRFADFMGMKLITLDMTTYQTDESLDRFVEVVSNYLTLYPWSVFLFEEIDKASISVLDRLYFLLDEGVFYDKYQRPLFARGAFVIMTTNAGQDIILDHAHDPNLRQLVNAELEKHFRPSFLNRFDSMPIFLPFTQAEFRQLAVVLSSKKVKQLKDRYNWTITIDSATIDYLTTNGQSPIYGARPMERLVENVMSFGLAEFQLNVGTIDYGASIALTKLVDANKFRIKVGTQQWDYVVNPEDNNGGGFTPGMSRLEQLQQNILKAFR